MRFWIYAALLAVGPAAIFAAPPAAAQPALPTKEQPKKEAAKPKPAAAAQGGNVATVNGVGVPRAREDLLVQQQATRGMPDNEQTRQMVRDELINREVISQEAQKSGFAKNAEVQTQLEMARQEVLVGAYLRDWVRKHPVSDADVQKEYDRAKSQSGEKEYKARHILVETEDQAKSVIADLKK